MVQMLIPFIENDTQKNEVNFIEQGRFDDYIEFGNKFIELTGIYECDVCLLPIIYELSMNRRSFEQEIAAFIARCEASGKKIIIFSGHDVMDVQINIKNSVVFNSALDKSNQPHNEQSWPHFFEDFLRKYPNGNVEPRNKGGKPVVGFCGYAPPLNVSMSKGKIISILKLVANYAGLIKKFPERASHSYRARAIIGLQNSNKINTNFRLKSNFAFGPSGLNTGNTNESNADFRKNFVDNILDSDYTLCVRGIGNNSIRFFETLCCGRIPVFVNTDSCLPFDSVINWKNLCVWVEEKDIDRVGDIVAEFHSRISNDEFIELQKKLRETWEEYLSPLGFFKNIALLINT